MLTSAAFLILAFSARPTFAAAVVELNDGTRIRADRLQADPESGELLLRIVRPGIEIVRRVKLDDVKTASVDGTLVWKAEAHVPVAELPPFEGTPSDSSGVSVAPICMPLPAPGTVIGVRVDPLSAYAGSVSAAYPGGVPLQEVEFALELMRARKAQDLLMPIPPPLGAPPPVDPAAPPVPDLSPSTELRPSALPMRNRVRSIAVAARPINSHGRIDFDSLELDVRALDLEGRVVPVNGTLQLTLWGQRQELIRTIGRVLSAEPGDVLKLGEWTRNLDSRTRAITAADGNVAATSRFVLPLSRPFPDHDLDVAALGDLHVKLAVPGEGVFEATVEGVPLRHRSPARDQRLIETGSSFFPGEGTTDSVRPAGSWRWTRPTSGPDRRVLSIEP